MTKIHDKCIDSQQLHQLINDQLDQDVESEVLRHLDQCPICQATMESLAAEKELWDELPTTLTRQQNGNRDQLADTCNHEQAFVDASINELLEHLGPTDDPNMLGRIGTYEICGVVGRGSTGIVLKSFEASLNRYVAIKVLSPTLSGNGAARKRFEREARAIAAVVHEHVVPIFAVDEHRGLPYFVMQYVTGSSLQHRIERQGPLDACEVVRISMQIANGLAAAHAQGIVHRDIKPANILLEHGLDRVMVSDFGLARVTDGATVTMSGMITGTPSYMAPEQARGDQIDQRSDLFSLGSVMYTMCTAAPPFPSETVYGVIRRICEAQPRSIRESNPEIPEWLVRLIAKLLSKRQEDRFDSADQVAAVLSHELAHLQNPTLVQAPHRAWAQPERELTDAKPAGASRSLHTVVSAAAVLFVVLVAAAALTNGTIDEDGKPDSSPQAVASTAREAQSDATPNLNAKEIESGAGATYIDVAALADARPAGGDSWQPPPPSTDDHDDNSQEFAAAIALAYPIDDITVDGDPADWPQELPTYTIERVEVGDRPVGLNDLSASFRIGYNADENALYVIVEVIDDSLVIDAAAGQTKWDMQDGCEIYLDKLHRPTGSPLAQYTRYGDSLNAYGSNAGVKGVGLIVRQRTTDDQPPSDRRVAADGTETSAATKTVRCYEWRIDLEDGVEAGRSMGFDLALLDKDKDGSFTWLTWGSGTQKIYAPGRCGDIILVDASTPLGEVTGQVDWQQATGHYRRRVRLQSLDAPELWTTVDCRRSGNYRAVLPVGSYSVEAADDVDHRFQQANRVEITIEADQSVEAKRLEVSLLDSRSNRHSWNPRHEVLSLEDGQVIVGGDDRRLTIAGRGVDVAELDARNDSIAFAYPMPPITIDGDLGDWPDNLPVYSIDASRTGDSPTDSVDLDASYRVGYNVEQQVLYVAVEVVDDSLLVERGASYDWTAQDGSEVYLDTEHRKNGMHVKQYNFYGNRLQGNPSNVQVATGSKANGRTFEWQIHSNDVISAGRSLGFDVSVLDKDNDGSFSWLAWGRGTQKAWYPQRCGNVLLIEPDTQFGKVTGKFAPAASMSHPSPRICFQSLDHPGMRPRIACDEAGNYQAELPAGDYLVGPVGHSAATVRVTIAANQTVEAAALQAARHQNENAPEPPAD